MRNFFAIRGCIAIVIFFLPALIAAQSAAPSPPYYNAENLRSDTFDILKYTIDLEVGVGTATNLKGNTKVRFAPKINNRSFIRLDLLKLNIDSIKENNSLLTYVYNDTVIRINFLTNKNVTDTSVITVFYNGIPKQDASWGGVYSGTSVGLSYVYNMGVGFSAKPHNYGRVWFPCFDNFVERSKYECIITCDSARKAYCGGQLISDVVTGAKRTRTWRLEETIPSYLASFAIAKYAAVNWTVNTLSGPKPIVLAAAATDTTALKNGFVNFKNCVTGFENYFGPYKWNRIGFTIVPFFGGAMEHATNIGYPRFALGSLIYERLMSHEFAHHWFGNLITCETPEDMWINEGLASFSAILFFEWQYGKAKYLTEVKTEHDDLLHFLHHNEGFRAVSGQPHSLTYGDHVYRKGADIAHTLRGYMEDVPFFNALKYTLQQKSYQAINSIELRNLMQTSSGQNLTDYFNNWVFSEGWSHFSIDSVNYFPSTSNTFDAVVSIKQKLLGAPALHSNVPLELSFFKPDRSRVIKKVVMSGATMNFTVNVPYAAVYCALNYDSKISDATSHDYRISKSTGALNMPLSKLPLQIQSAGTDSSLIRIIHNYVKPDPFKSTSTHKISDQHFWKVEGIMDPAFKASAQFNYNGYKGTSGTYLYLDTLLTIVNGDSIALFYRKNVSADWSWVKKATKVKVNAKSGYFTLDTLKLGEYTFANLGDTTIVVGVKTHVSGSGQVMVYPNPAKQKCTLDLKKAPAKPAVLSFISMEGKTVQTDSLSAAQNQIDLSKLVKGAYTITVHDNDGWLIHSQKFVIE